MTKMAPGPRILDLLDLVRRLRDELETSLKEQGGCDHPVGICACSSIHTLEDADVFLGRLERCGSCFETYAPRNGHACESTAV